MSTVALVLLLWVGLPGLILLIALAHHLIRLARRPWAIVIPLNARRLP